MLDSTSLDSIFKSLNLGNCKVIKTVIDLLTRNWHGGVVARLAAYIIDGQRKGDAWRYTFTRQTHARNNTHHQEIHVRLLPHCCQIPSVYCQQGPSLVRRMFASTESRLTMERITWRGENIFKIARRRNTTNGLLIIWAIYYGGWRFEHTQMSLQTNVYCFGLMMFK